MIGASSRELEWDSPVFAAPFSLDVEHLKAAHFPAAGQAAAHDEPLSFQTAGGDVIHGRLVDITNDSLVVESRRHGRIRLTRPAIRSFGRVDPRVLDTAEAPSSSGWRRLSTAQTVSEWQANAVGHLTTRVQDAELGGDFKLPDVAEFDLALSWTGEPLFVISCAAVKAMRFGGDVVTIEAADGQLLLKGPGRADSQHLVNLHDGTKRIRFRMLWDQRLERLSVFTSGGTLLARTGINRSVGTGLHIKNRGSDLTVEHLRTRPSDGVVGREMLDGEAHFRLFDGESFYGRLVGFDRSSGAVLAEDSVGARRTIAADNLVGLYFTAAAGIDADAAQVKVRYYDGTVLRGRVHSIDDATLKLDTSFSDDPVPSRLGGIRELVFLSVRRVAPQGTTDVLEIGGGGLTGVLHGTLGAVEGEASKIGWKPVGSKNASAISGDHPVRVVRRAIRGDDAATRLPRTDVLYLDNGDVIPCRFQSLDQEHAVIASAIGQQAQVPLSRVRAIEFNSETAVPVMGFHGDAWKITEREEGAVRLVDDKAVFTGPATLSHENLMQGDDLQFQVRWNPETQCVVTVALHARENRAAADNTLLLYFLQGRLLVRGPQGRAFVGQEVLRERQNTNCEAKVQISASGKNAEVFVDGAQLITYPLPDRERMGRGIMFSVQPVAVRRVQVVDANGGVRQVVEEDAQEELLTISDLTVSRLGNAMRYLSVDATQMESVLTVPRMHKTNPPSHVLVAQNGDLLRGQLTGMTDELVHFKSRLDTVAIPRERVDAIVWLKKPPAEAEEQAVVAEAAVDQAERGPSEVAAAAADAADDAEGAASDDDHVDDTVRVMLASGTRLTFLIHEMTETTIVGEHPILGVCRISSGDVLELQVGEEVQPRNNTALAYSQWQLTPAKEPFPGSGDVQGGSAPGFGVDSALVGTDAADFSIELLDGRNFRLSDHADKVVVLDFWTTWCGPCARAVPQIAEAVSQFPPDQVMLVAVNLEETEKTIRDYLAAHEWDLTVAVDREGRVGRQYQVEAIPQTVIVGKGGKIERIHVGSHPNLQAELTSALQELLD
jgi:thiol-disulfide isomerase/thioredoxin/small nuclear ribonucleoprotein (snRNP)-like protein